MPVHAIIFIINLLIQKEDEVLKERLCSLSFCVHAVQAVPRKQRMSCPRMSYGNSIVLPTSSTSVKSRVVKSLTLVM